MLSLFYQRIVWSRELKQEQKLSKISLIRLDSAIVQNKFSVFATRHICCFLNYVTSFEKKPICIADFLTFASQKKRFAEKFTEKKLETEKFENCWNEKKTFNLPDKKFVK